MVLLTYFYGFHISFSVIHEPRQWGLLDCVLFQRLRGGALATGRSFRAELFHTLVTGHIELFKLKLKFRF